MMNTLPFCLLCGPQFYDRRSLRMRFLSCLLKDCGAHCIATDQLLLCTKGARRSFADALAAQTDEPEREGNAFDAPLGAVARVGLDAREKFPTVVGFCVSESNPVWSNYFPFYSSSPLRVLVRNSPQDIIQEEN